MVLDDKIVCKPVRIIKKNCFIKVHILGQMVSNDKIFCELHQQITSCFNITHQLRKRSAKNI